MMSVTGSLWHDSIPLSFEMHSENHLSDALFDQLYEQFQLLKYPASPCTNT